MNIPVVELILLLSVKAVCSGYIQFITSTQTNPSVCVSVGSEQLYCYPSNITVENNGTWIRRHQITHGLLEDLKYYRSVVMEMYNYTKGTVDLILSCDGPNAVSGCMMFHNGNRVITLQMTNGTCTPCNDEAEGFMKRLGSHHAQGLNALPREECGRLDKDSGVREKMEKGAGFSGGCCERSSGGSAQGSSGGSAQGSSGGSAQGSSGGSAQGSSGGSAQGSSGGSAQGSSGGSAQGSSGGSAQGSSGGSAQGSSGGSAQGSSGAPLMIPIDVLIIIASVTTIGGVFVFSVIIGLCCWKRKTVHMDTHTSQEAAEDCPMTSTV